MFTGETGVEKSVIAKQILTKLSEEANVTEENFAGCADWKENHLFR